MTTLAGQPYPAADAWQDLAPHLMNGWSRRGAAGLAYLVDTNTVSVSAALIIGTARTIATGLDGLVSASRPVTAFAQTSTSSRPLNVNLKPDGTLVIEPGHWDFVQQYNNIVIGGTVPR